MCQLCRFHAPPDQDFAQRLLGTINQGALGLMISIGHRTGLFDAMGELAEPADASAIAANSGLNERYVREWLGAMVAGKIVLTDPETGAYWLPPEHAACLTRASGADNMAVFTQYLAVLGGVESDVVRSFREGGGVPYGRFERFHDVMAEDSGQSALSSLESAIIPLIPGLRKRLERGVDVLDLGCGKGRVVNRLARAFPKSRFTGLDISEEALESARAEAGALGAGNVSFVRQDAAAMEAFERYDWIATFDAIHDQARPDVVLRAIRRALRPGGVYLMQDIQGSGSHADDADHPLAPFIYTISCMHCMTVSLASGGMGLGAAWGKPTALRMLAEAGFGDVETHELDHDVQNFYYVARP